jgi:tripartite-type tricarboxylate transporter receptor subunit TctC
MADNRLSALPNTPTLKEKGINASFATVRGIVVLKGTPQAVIDKLEAGFLKAMKHPVYQNYLTGAGLDSSSVAGAAAWDMEIKKIYKEARAALVSLGLAK